MFNFKVSIVVNYYSILVVLDRYAKLNNIEIPDRCAVPERPENPDRYAIPDIPENPEDQPWLAETAARSRQEKPEWRKAQNKSVNVIHAYSLLRGSSKTYPIRINNNVHARYA